MTRWITSLIGGRPGWHAAVREAVVRALIDRNLTPATMTLRDEDGPLGFDAAAATREMAGPWPGVMLLEGAGASLVLSLGARSRLALTLDGERAGAIELADVLAAIVEPDLGWLVPDLRLPLPLATDDARLVTRLVASAGPGGDFDARGPGGLGMVTWLGPQALAHADRAVLDHLDADVTEPAWGGVRIELRGDDPVVAAHAWSRAMAALAPLFGTSTVDDATGAVRFVPPPWWKRDALGGPVDSIPPTAPRDPDPLRALVAAAAGGAPVAGISARGVDATGARLERLNAERVDLGGAVLVRARLAHAVLVDCDLDRARLDGADLTSAHLDQVGLREARGSRAVFAGADLTSSFLEGAELPDADFGGAAFALCELDRLSAPRADFEGALLENCRLRGANLDGARFLRAELVSCDFAGASLIGASFEGAKLDGCSFAGARVDGVRWPDPGDRA